MDDLKWFCNLISKLADDGVIDEHYPLDTNFSIDEIDRYINTKQLDTPYKSSVVGRKHTFVKGDRRYVIVIFNGINGNFVYVEQFGNIFTRLAKKNINKSIRNFFSPK